MIKKKKKETWIRGYKEEIQTSPSRQIDTVNRGRKHHRWSAATIISLAFRGGDEIASRHVLRVTPFYRRGFLRGEFEHAKERERKRREKRRGKKTSTEVEKRSTGKIYAKRRRHVEDCRRSSDRKRPRAHFLRFAHVDRLSSLPLGRERPLSPSLRHRPRRHGLIENSIILFLSTGWRVLPRIDSRIYNATWVSELTASTGCAHTELAYWTAFWGPARKRAGSPRPLESV